MDEQVFSKEFWRLGHRRPWWQWNVITLFVPLFLLVWIREFLRVPQGVTWLMCMAVLAAWFALPPLFMPSQEQAADSARPTVDAPASDGVHHGYLLAAAAMFGCVVLAGGVVAGALSVLAAMLYAAAVRREL
jgi:hypothetical protein